MKVKVTHGHGWYACKVGNIFEIGSIDTVEGVNGMCLFPLGQDVRFIESGNCTLEENLPNNIPVKTGDVVYIDRCEECPDADQKFGVAIPSDDAPGFTVDIPSDVYRDYTYISPESDTWKVVQRNGIFQKESKGSQKKTDSINHPTHYNSGKFETIEVIEEVVSNYNDSFLSYNIGNVQKYISRAPFKHDTPLDDLKKAAKYLEFAINHLEKNQ